MALSNRIRRLEEASRRNNTAGPQRFVTLWLPLKDNEPQRPRREKRSFGEAVYYDPTTPPNDPAELPLVEESVCVGRMS